MNNDHTIAYSALALRKPLAALCAKFSTHIEKLEPKMPDAVALSKQKRGTLAAPTDEEIAANKLLSEYRKVSRELERAELWLAECKRLWPWVRFRLTIDEIAWLYQKRGVVQDG